MTRPFNKTDLQNLMKQVNSWKPTASRMIMSKKEYDDIISLEQFECPACGVMCNRNMGHPEDGCDWGKIYNIMSS
jgi:hypothetical protein